MAVTLFVGMGLYSQYQEFSRESLIERFIQNPWEAMRVGIIILIAFLGSASLSSMLAGWIAREKGWISGIIVSPFLPLLGILGGIAQGKPLALGLRSLVMISILLAIDAFFGFLGEKISKRSLKRNIQT